MFTSVVTALALVASVSRVAASPVHHAARAHAQAARNYRQDAEILEDYTPYHVRYIALNCQGQHNTTFFEDCCHPLLRWQKLSDRPSQCIPSASASSSAAAVEPTASTIDEDPIYSDDCDESTSSAAAVATATSQPPAGPTYTTSYGAITSEKHTSAHPTSTQAPATTDEPTTTQSPTSTKHTHTSAAQATTSASSGGGGGGQVFTGGQGTWYTQDGTTGACGIKHGDYDLIVAPDYRTYGDINSVSPLCGKQVRITNTDNGKSVTATIADVCPTCENKNSIDMSLGTFQQIGDFNTGVLPISWEFV